MIPIFLDYLRSLVTLTKIETTFEDFLQATTLMKEYGLDEKMWDDLVIYSQMKRMKINEIYSNDSDYDKLKDIKRIFQ